MIHPSAIVSPKAKLGTDVTIGPYCVVGADVVLHDHVRLRSHVVVEGHTTIGTYTDVYAFACLGCTPQNQNTYDTGARLIIGEHNVIREYVIMQPGIQAPKGQLVTRVGDHNLIMSHGLISHDCVIGNHCTFASYVGLAGHVIVGDHVILGGSVGVHQWVRIGNYAMVGGLSGIAKDVLPYALTYGTREATCHGPNIIGLKRHGFTNDQIRSIASVYGALRQKDQPMTTKIESLMAEHGESAVIAPLLDFLQNIGQRGMTDWA